MKRTRPTETTLPIANVGATLRVRTSQGRAEVTIHSGPYTAPLGLVDVASGQVTLHQRILTAAIRRRVLRSLADGLESLAISTDKNGSPLHHSDGRPVLSDIAPLVLPLARQAQAALQAL